MANTAGNFVPPGCDSTVHTPAALIAIRDAGELVPNCHYFVQVPAQGLLGATIAELHAVEADLLSKESKVSTIFDNEAWLGILDLDAGFYQELKDNLGNTVRDFTDGSTIAQFPWGNTNYRDNFVEDTVLAGWDTQAGSVRDNVIVGASINLTGKVSGTISANEIRDTALILGAGGGAVNLSSNKILGSSVSLTTINHSGAGAISISSTRIVGNFTINQSGAGNLTVTSSLLSARYISGPDILHTGGGAITINNCEMNANPSATMVQHTGAGGSISLSRSKIESGTIRKLGASGNVSVTRSRCNDATILQAVAATGLITISDADVSGSSVTVNGAGGITVFSNSTVEGSALSNSAAATRSLTLQSSVLFSQTVTQNRTGGTGTDSITGCRMFGASGFPVTLNGAADPGGNQTIFNFCEVMAAVISVTDPTGSPGPAVVVFQSTRFAGAANITAPAGVQLVQKCRFDIGATVNLGAFTHESTIIEGNLTKTLTANNLYRLCNKGFDDTI